MSRWCVGLVVMLLASVRLASGQPDPRQMSGIPLPDAQLPDGTISVRVIRGQLSNNVPEHPVELRQGDIVETAATDAEGRATFLTLNPGQQVRAATDLDGTRIESQLFAVPGRGGVRLMLVGADLGTPPVEAPPGLVTFGGDSFIQIKLVEEAVEVYYLLELINPAQVVVEPPVPIALDLPDGAQGVTVLQGSSSGTVVEGPRVELSGPFDPGATRLRVAFILSYSGDRLAIEQPFPIDLEALLLSMERWGDVELASSQIARLMEIPAETAGGTDYLVGAGPRIGVDDALSVELTGLPHRSSLPRRITLGITMIVLGVGCWGAVTPRQTDGASRTRKRLHARRERLFHELVKIERRHRHDKIGSTRYTTRRGELFAGLEKVYRELGDLDAELTPVVPGSARVAPGGSPVTDH